LSPGTLRKTSRAKVYDSGASPSPQWETPGTGSRGTPEGLSWKSRTRHDAHTAGTRTLRASETRRGNLGTLPPCRTDPGTL
jgi:hypothetical protein